MPCSQLRPIGFIVLCENIRNGRICHSPVQQLRISVNHLMVQCVQSAAKIFTDFTRIVFWTAKLSRRCTARYGKTDLVYAGFAYRPPIQRQILHAAVKYSTVRTSKMVFKNGIKNSRTGCTACTAILQSVPRFQYGSGLTTSIPTKPRTRLPPT